MLLTTQNLEEADQLADRVAVFDHGRVVAEGTPAELKRAAGSGVLRLRLGDARRRDDARRLLAEHLGTAINVDGDPKLLTAAVSDPARAADAVASLARSGVAVDDFALSQPSLDEVFLALTGHANETERS